jgi:DedD protein
VASKFQSRLVGTVILVAIGVIVLPDVLDGEKQHYKEEFATIPIRPEVVGDEDETFEVIEPVAVDATIPDSTFVKDDETREQELAVEASKPEVEKVAFKDSAWIIQLMALKNAANAETLVKDLQKRGYRAHTKQENGFTRVIVGPDVSRTKLEKQVIELKKITGSKGQILKFKALNP